MSKHISKPQKVEPPHSLRLRAKERPMPSTVPANGVYTIASATSPAPSQTPAAEASAEDSDISPRQRQIHSAINRVKLDDLTLWTKNKGPRVDALEAILGYQITEAERDDAWNLEIRSK